MVSGPVRRQQVRYAEGRGISVRRACQLLGVARSALNYSSKLDERGRQLITHLKQMAYDNPRYGYRRCRGLLWLGGMRINHKRAESGVQVGEELTSGLKAIGRQEGVTLFMVMVAGFEVMLSRYSGQQPTTGFRV
jgi:hypothetical protein